MTNTETLNVDPLEDHAVVVVGDSGQFEPPPSAKPGDCYVVAKVPEDAVVNVQPPSIVSGGVRRRVLTVECYYLLADPKANTERHIPANDANRDALPVKRSTRKRKATPTNKRKT